MINSVPEDSSPHENSTKPQLSIEQRLEQRRQRIEHSLGIISGNMIDLDGYRMSEGSVNRFTAVDAYDHLADIMGAFPQQLSITDGLRIAGAQEISDQLLAEINRRRSERGKQPAETVFDPSKTTDIAPITPVANNIDILQFSTDLTDAISDYPRVFPEESADDSWGRVNVLRHPELAFGVADISTGAFDQTRHQARTNRFLYQGSRLAGRWEQVVGYYRNVTRGENLPYRLGTYTETIFDRAGRKIENVEVGFDNQGRVYDISNIHYINGEKSGTTQLQIKYSGEGRIIGYTQIELDASGNQLSQVEKPYIADPQDVTTESSDQSNEVIIDDKNKEEVIPKKPVDRGDKNMINRLNRFLRHK